VGLALIAIVVSCSNETDGGAPPVALASDENIRVTRTSDVAPEGVVAVSALYRFEPDGFTFVRLARVSFKLDAAETDVVVMWSSSSDRTRFDTLASAIAGSTTHRC
jgi:hypothetical protein